ncbi:MAG: ATP-binding cassette domain-containing protein [Alphaproteobacteria bacterium]|nr:ATP-binding cassette domain-containing protein [Alphaproteobacteria bacterium]
MLHINDLTYRVGGRVLLDEATAVVPRGHKIGLVGRNGTGKSTLLRLIMGELEADGGSLNLRNDAKVGTVAQQTPEGEQSPRDFVLAADEERNALLAEASEVEDPNRIAEIHIRLADIGAETAPARAAAILAGLGFDEEAQTRPLDTFSGGWRMRVALAATLFSAPDLLLLDEPSNHLDLETRLWLENHLVAYQGTIILVSHDRNLLNTVVDTIIHLDDCKLTVYRGDYDWFEKERRERMVLQAAQFAKQLEQRQHMQAFVDRFRYKASKARQAQSRLKALERMEELRPVRPDHEVAFDFPDPDQMAPPLIALDNASVGYEPGTPVLSRLGLTLDMDDRIALLGENGNGKTTLLRLLMGELQTMSGSIRHSSKMRVGYFAQEQADAFDPERTARQEMALRLPDAMETKIRSHLGRFGFTQERADVKVASLSGGEKAKLLFACITRDAPHVLLLDEPTNHLDIDSRQALVGAISAYKGAVILVTHDLHLVELCADRLWIVRNGTCNPFDGDIDEYKKTILESRRAARRRDRSERADGKQDRRDARRASASARAARASQRKAAAAAERRLEALGKEKVQIEAKLADPALYRGPPFEIAMLNKQLADLDRKIAAVEADWLAAEEAIG